LSGKPPAEIYEILAPNLVSSSLFEAIKKVAKTPGDVNLPQWLIDCFLNEEDQYIE